MGEWVFPNDNVIALTIVPLKFGMGVTSEAGYELKRLGIKKALLLTDTNISKTGLANKVKDMIEGDGVKVELYDKVHFEPTDVSMTKAYEDIKDADCDGFVALGGGSTIDTAKVCNLLFTNPANIIDYVNKPIGKALQPTKPLKPMLAIPTTGGTGSECTPVAVLDLLDLKVKSGISSAAIRPTMALIDPLNTISCPPEVTMACGLDVLCHAAESFTNRPYDTYPRRADPGARPAYIGCNPISDMWSAKAIEYSGKYLVKAVLNPNDLEARQRMAFGATFAGIGFGNAGLHFPHSLAYPIAGMVREYVPPGYKTEEVMVPHGISVLVTAPACFRFTAPACPEKHAEAARLLGVNTSSMTLMEAAYSLADALQDLMKETNCPNGIGALGFTSKDIPDLVAGAMKQQRLLAGSPRLYTEDDIAKIFEDSLKYW